MFYVMLFALAYQKMKQAIEDIEWPFGRGVALGACSGVIYFFFAGLTQNTWESTFVAGTFWLFIGIVTAMNRKTTLRVHDRKKKDGR